MREYHAKNRDKICKQWRDRYVKNCNYNQEYQAKKKEYMCQYRKRLQQSNCM